MPSLLIASTNKGKIAEVRSLLEQSSDLAGITLLTPNGLTVELPDIDENAETFSENARLKANAWSKATGYIVIADDSGLCVDALRGAPGVHSARWAGPEATDQVRNELLLKKLQGVPQAGRTSRFVCAAVAVAPDGREIVEEGICEGIITDTPQGTAGFGYDPVFLVPHLARTMAELSFQEKNAISHRFQAFSRLIPRISELIS
jgi:XTP/dITP diphosphohydrolase